MDSNQLPFKENTILTAEGESFAMPLAYKGWPLYFGSLEYVDVPRSLQPELGYELSKVFNAETFTQSSNGDTEIGIVTVNDGDKKRSFKVTITLVKTGRDDYYLVDSILEVLK